MGQQSMEIKNNMKDKKFQVFVSSTYTDLKEERQAAVEAILSAGHIPAGMELFSAGDESQMTVIKRWIDESDIYLLILGGRYGTIEPRSGKSYTHLEFEYALEKKKPLFSVVINKDALINKEKKMGINAIEQENQKALEEFKSVVTSNIVEFWDDKKDIQLAIFKTLSDFIYRKELVGWIRGDNNINTALLAEEIARLTNENSDLREKLSTINITPTQLYAGLSYSDMRDLLKNTKVRTRNKETDLFDHIVRNGEGLSIGQSFSPEFQEFELDVSRKLTELGIVQKNGSNYKFKFTTDGHIFYIKTLYQSKLAHVY